MISRTFITLLAISLTVTTARAQAPPPNFCGCQKENPCSERASACKVGFNCPCDSFTDAQCIVQEDGVPVFSECVEAGATGDPLFRAFDGSTFYFHGIHEHKYVIHARKYGDTLVAKMRATNELWMGINRTYFEQFGLRLAGSKDRLRFFLKRDTMSSRWKIAAEVNGKPFISKPSPFNSASDVQILEHPNNFKVTSPFADYTIKGVSLTSIYRRHLDFSIKINKIHPEHQFSGILGRTVSKNIPFRIRKVDSDGKKKIFEMKMRELYTVPTLFPSTHLLKKVKFVSPEEPLI